MPRNSDTRFEVGQTYTRVSVQETLGLPNPTTTGKWGTGYTRHEGEFFIFANVGTPGRTGHDYANAWLADGRLQRESKRDKRVGQPEITALISPTTRVHIFWRETDRGSFVYAGIAVATDVEDVSPVRLKWRLDGQPAHVVGSGTTRSTHVFGAPYRPANEEVDSQRQPFEVDPSAIERGCRGHARTQNLLAEHLRRLGLVPLSPPAQHPEYDLAWAQGETLFVAEIKSVTEANEEKQLRLGLGQVLRYRQLLQRQLGQVVGVLVPEREPQSPGWHELCSQLGIRLAWPGAFDRLREGQ